MGGAKGGWPEGWVAQNFAFYFSPPFRSFCVSLCVFSSLSTFRDPVWWCVVLNELKKFPLTPVFGEASSIAKELVGVQGFEPLSWSLAVREKAT